MQIEAEFGEITLRIQGRADAVRRWAGDPILEEIKTTRRNPSAIAPDAYPVHWAQVELYAAILCRKEGFPRCEVALVYLLFSTVLTFIQRAGERRLSSYGKRKT